MFEPTRALRRLSDTAMIVFYEGLLIHFVSIEDILAAKTIAKRDKDSETLPELLDNQEQDQK